MKDIIKFPPFFTLQDGDDLKEFGKLPPEDKAALLRGFCLLELLADMEHGDLW